MALTPINNLMRFRGNVPQLAKHEDEVDVGRAFREKKMENPS